MTDTCVPVLEAIDIASNSDRAIAKMLIEMQRDFFGYHDARSPKNSVVQMNNLVRVAVRHHCQLR